METVSKSESVRNLIVGRIRAGHYGCGSALPSIETLAGEFGVSKNTVSLALASLREAGIITLEHGKATRVTGKLFQRHVEIIAFGQLPLKNDNFWGEFNCGIEAELAVYPEITFHHVQILESCLHRNEPVPEHIRRGGVLLVGTANEDYLRRLRREHIPYAVVYESAEGMEIPSFSVDYGPVMEQLVARFAAAGCRRIAYVGLIQSAVIAGIRGANWRKWNAFRQALLRHGLAACPELEIQCEHFMSRGYLHTQQLLADPAGRPDAIFYASDILAPGGYKAIRKAGLRVPDDIQVAGCDDLEIGDYIFPPLSTITFDRFEIGRAAAAALLGRMFRREAIRPRVFPARLRERDSLSPLRRGVGYSARLSECVPLPSK